MTSDLDIYRTAKLLIETEKLNRESPSLIHRYSGPYC